MNELLKKIYDNVLVYEKDAVSAGKPVEEEIHCIIKHYQERLHGDELEELRDLLSSLALTAEQSGFETGVRFVIKLLYSLFSS